MNNCLHVKVTATREQLHEMGICSDDTFDLLLSGRAFAVDKKEKTGSGKVMVHLVHPKSNTHLLWVYEEFTQPVHY